MKIFTMYKSLFIRWSPMKRIATECISKIYEAKRNIVYQNQWRPLSVSIVSLKKRKPPEEKAIENHGGRVIRYSPKAGKEVVGIWRNMTVQDVANILNKDLGHVFKSLEFADKSSGIEYTANTVIHNPQVVRDIVKISGYRFKLVPPPDQEAKEEESKDAVPAPPAPPAALRPRAPVVCVMGHVDHGKTTLLDALRDTAVVDQEFGGITQHIGAFQVEVPAASWARVTFLDTPGHAAFSAMRARGATATDLVVLVVAADDGVMDQTVESIRMAREAQVPILVAVNKIDKPGVNIERTLRSLAQHGVVCEALGGDVQAVPVSALKRQNLDTLVEAITLQAQLMDLRADYDGYVEGVVLEAHLDPKIGRCATAVVSRGTLRRGAVLVAGLAWAKVRALRAADGSAMDSAVPGTPAVLHGWRELPAAGDLVLEVSSEKRAHEVMRWRRAQRMKDKQEADRDAIEAKSLEHQRRYKDLLAAKRARGRIRTRPDGPRQKMIQHDDHPTLSLVVKGDVDGSVEAVLDLLDTYDEHDRVRLDLVHYAVGPLTPTDIEIAEAFNAVIYAFNVDCPPALEAEAKDKGIPIKHHNVIYRLVDDVKAEISNRIPPEEVEEVIGEANVLQQFYVSAGRARLPVAGARCTKGELHKDAYYRLVRDGELVYDGKLASMKHLKEEVSVIKRDTECGLRLQSDVEVRPGDTLQCYRRTERAPVTRWDPGF